MAKTVDLYRSYLDDPTLSDLTLKLSDRTVHVHRIVLCRASEYFTSLLTRSFQESSSKEVELHEDDPDAMMALLHHIYGLPYDELPHGGTYLLSQHASTFVVAEKYQIPGLQSDVCDKIERTFASHIYPIEDFLKAVRTIFSSTRQNSIARLPMARECTTCLKELRGRDDFEPLLRDLPDLGLDIIKNPDLECAFPGDWLCEYTSDCRGMPSCPLLVEIGESNVSASCGYRYDKSFSWEYRDEKRWKCPCCGGPAGPMCTTCNARIKWSTRGLDLNYGPTVFEGGF